MSALFSGIRVIDVTKVFSGPFATRLLADYGAEVLKIESPDHPDDSRSYAPIRSGWSGYFEIVNRNKKGLALDLKDPAALESLYSLVKDADVFVENMTPMTKHSLHIDYERLREINPRLVYASLSGVGQDSNEKYYDVIAQAQSGLLSLTGTPDHPTKIGPSVVDAFSGMTLAFAIAGALFFRERTGQGQYLDVAMKSCAMNLLENNLIEYSLTHQNPIRAGDGDLAIAPFGVYPCRDASITLAIGNDRLWQTFSTVMFPKEQSPDPQFKTNIDRLKHAAKLTAKISSAFSSYTAAELEATLLAHGIPCSRIYEMSDVAADESNFSRGALERYTHAVLGEIIIPGSSIHFSGTDSVPLSQAPAVGEDNARYGL